LDRDGVEGVPGGDDPVCLAAAEPDPALIVQIAHVTHAVPDAAGRIGDLGQAGRLGAVQVGAADLRAAHGDLADRTCGKRQVTGPSCYQGIADRYDVQGNAL